MIVFMKHTKSRKAILDILDNAGHPMNAMDILKAASSGTLTLSTIYRALGAFEQEGLVNKDVSSHTRDALYSIKEDEHGHVLECVKCHKKVHLNYCPFDEVNKEIEEKTGFELEDENHILYGVCADCREKK